MKTSGFLGCFSIALVLLDRIALISPVVSRVSDSHKFVIELRPVKNVRTEDHASQEEYDTHHNGDEHQNAIHDHGDMVQTTQYDNCNLNPDKCSNLHRKPLPKSVFAFLSFLGLLLSNLLYGAVQTSSLCTVTSTDTSTSTVSSTTTSKTTQTSMVTNTRTLTQLSTTIVRQTETITATTVTTTTAPIMTFTVNIPTAIVLTQTSIKCAPLSPAPPPPPLFNRV